MKRFDLVHPDQKAVFRRSQMAEEWGLGLESVGDQWSSDWGLGRALKPQTELAEECCEQQLANL